METEEYYKNLNNLNLITKELIGHETIFMSPDGKIIRCIKAFNTINLIKNIEHYQLIKNNYNIYKSIAKYKEFPLFSWKRDTRFKQYNAWTDKEIYKKHLNGYDYYIDFDKKDFTEKYLKQEVQDTSDYLTFKGIKHLIYSSGNGYHLKAWLKPINQNPEYCKKLTLKLIEKLGLLTPDLSIYKYQSIIKTPYSIDIKTKRICTPIRPDMFKDFKKEETNI